MGVEVGEEIPAIEQAASLRTAVAYAAASGDHNPLHFDQNFAAEVSPTGGVIVHGMYSMGLASRALTEWVGGPEHVVELDVRFTKPWPVGATAKFGGTVTDVSEGVATVELWGRLMDEGVQIMKGTGRVRT